MVWWYWSSTEASDDVTNSDGPTSLSPIPISVNICVSDDEYKSLRLHYLIRAPTPIVQFHNVEYNGVKTKWMMMLICRCKSCYYIGHYSPGTRRVLMYMILASQGHVHEWTDI